MFPVMRLAFAVEFSDHVVWSNLVVRVDSWFIVDCVRTILSMIRPLSIMFFWIFSSHLFRQISVVVTVFEGRFASSHQHVVRFMDCFLRHNCHQEVKWSTEVMPLLLVLCFVSHVLRKVILVRL